MEIKHVRQNIRRQKGVDPDAYLKMVEYQKNCCAMCHEKQDKYTLVPNTLRLTWELSLVCRSCLHTLIALTQPDEGLMKEYMRESIVR